MEIRIVKSPNLPDYLDKLIADRQIHKITDVTLPQQRSLSAASPLTISTQQSRYDNQIYEKCTSMCKV